MKLEILAARILQAQNRTIAAANDLSNHLELPWPELAQKHRDGQVQQLWRNEALAEFLETAVATLTALAAVTDETVGYPSLTSAQAEKAFSKDDLVAHLETALGVSADVLTDRTKSELVALMELSIEDALAALEKDGAAG